MATKRTGSIASRVGPALTSTRLPARDCLARQLQAASRISTGSATSSGCEPFLLQQIEAIAPRIILALGNFAAKTLLRTDTGITRLRGQWHTYHGIPLMPTFHPAYLLRNPAGKRAAWSDLQAVMTEMDRLGLRRRQSQT